MNLFERYLTLWVALCIAVGIGNPVRNVSVWVLA